MCYKKDLEAEYGQQNVVAIINRLKLEGQMLQRLKHTNILGLVQPIIEGPKEIAMVTEPIIGSLANVLKDLKGLASPPDVLKNYELSDTEVLLYDAFFFKF